MSTDYAAKVAEGVKFLDENASSDWRSEIDLDNLRLESCEVCVLGQIFGQYEDGLSELGIDSYEATGYGFSTNGSWQELTQAWKDALGTNNTLVELGDIYADTATGSCCAVRVVSTKSVEISPGKTEMVYIVQSGSVVSGRFTTYDSKQVSVLFKHHFEANGSYQNKIEPVKALQLKKGMFVTNDTGKVWYVVSVYWLREVADQAQVVGHDKIAGSNGLREVTTYSGKKFSETINN